MIGRNFGIMMMSMLWLTMALVCFVRMPSSRAAEIAVNGGQRQVSAGQNDLDGILNPHSDLVFRATGTTKCRDCHAVKDSTGHPSVLDNAAVRSLIAKGKGAHGPGRFADCFRCHSGGRKGVEKYSDG